MAIKRHKRADRRGTPGMQNLPFYSMKGQEWRREQDEKDSKGIENVG